MSGIHVDIQEMQALASQFATRAGELEQLLSQVEGLIVSLTSIWQGQAADQFSSLMAEWSTDARGIRDVLATVSQQVNRAASAYQEGDESFARQFQVP
jgi:WXG100 family type VII secretion target